MNKRRSIYLGEPLMRLAEEIVESKNGGFHGNYVRLLSDINLL